MASKVVDGRNTPACQVVTAPTAAAATSAATAATAAAAGGQRAEQWKQQNPEYVPGFSLVYPSYEHFDDGVMRNMHRGKQTTNRRRRATVQVSFYDGSSHESSSSTVRTEVRSPAGRGSLFSVAFSRRRHRPHAADRAPGRGGVLAGHRHPVRVPAAVSARATGRRCSAFAFAGRDPRRTKLFAPQTPYTVSGLLFFVKFAAALLGVWLMHVGVRGPISFARLRHVLVFRGRRRWCRRWPARWSRSALRGGFALGRPGFLAARCRAGG